MTVDDPLIIVEVVLPTSGKTEPVDKLAEYFSRPTVRHDVLVWQKNGTIEHHTRDDGGVITTLALRAGDTLRFDPPGFEVLVADLSRVER